MKYHGALLSKNIVGMKKADDGVVVTTRRIFGIGEAVHSVSGLRGMKLALRLLEKEPATGFYQRLPKREIKAVALGMKNEVLPYEGSKRDSRAFAITTISALATASGFLAAYALPLEKALSTSIGPLENALNLLAPKVDWAMNGFAMVGAQLLLLACGVMTYGVGRVIYVHVDEKRLGAKLQKLG